MDQAEDLVQAEASEVTEHEEVVDENREESKAVVEVLDQDQKIGLVEALLFANGEPLTKDRLVDASTLEEAEIDAIIKTLREKFAGESSGFELVEVAGALQLRTKGRYAPFLRALRASAPRRLSNAALETLSIVAYRQPIVKSDVEKIRGVDATPTLKTLLERNLVRIVGHQPTVGQPALYGTTDEFLKLFGLSSLAELPTLRDLGELEKDPGESGEEPVEVAPEATQALS